MPHRSVSLPVLLLGTALAATPHSAFAQETAAEIALSDESAQLRFLLGGVGDGESNEVGLGLLLNENRDVVTTLHLYFEPDELQFRRLTFKAGPIAYAALLSTENTDVFSVALGAELRYEFLRRQEIFLVATAAHAPDILSFGAADGLLDLAGRIEVPLTDRVTGFAGYRRFEIDLLTGRRELEESAHLGIRYLF